jgi:octaprenyl-diphosphate synthase
MAELLDLAHDQVARFSRAIEMIHASSLAHDDVIDNATLRRGVPSINIVTSNKKAILAGDYLLSQVLKDACHSGNLKIVSELAQTISDLAEGEWVQIENTLNKSLSRQDVDLVALKKTGSIMRLCCLIPCMLMSEDDHFHSLARKFGEKLGVAFQLADDILDLNRRDGSQFQDLLNGTINAVIFSAVSNKQRSLTIDATAINTRALESSDLAAGILLEREQLARLSNELNALLDELYEKFVISKSEASYEAYICMQRIIDHICMRQRMATATP